MERNVSSVQNVINREAITELYYERSKEENRTI